MRSDTILFEKYYRGNTDNSHTIAWSVTKSFVSALMGIAIEEGYIKNIEETASQYILQLNKFAEAEKILETEVANQLKKRGEEWVHHLDLFYLGISKYEQKEYEGAVEVFDRALKLYPQFSDAQYYKGISLGRSDKIDEAEKLIAEAEKNEKQGYTINEDNAIYERYPYQVRWQNR